MYLLFISQLFLFLFFYKIIKSFLETNEVKSLEKKFEAWFYFLIFNCITFIFYFLFGASLVNWIIAVVVTYFNIKILKVNLDILKIYKNKL